MNNVALYTHVQISFWEYIFSVGGCTSRSGISVSYGRSIFNFPWSLHSVLNNDFIMLHSYQHYTRIPISPHLSQHLLFSIIFIVPILMSMRCYLIVVLVCISLIMSDVEHFFHVSNSHLYIFFGEMSIEVLYSFFLMSAPWCQPLPLNPQQQSPQTLWHQKG